DPTIDEGAYIDRMLDATKLKGHTVTPTSDELMRDLRKLHWHHENIIPGPSMYLEWALMRDARALGYKVILDGQGADEVFAGYATYLKAYQAELANRGILGKIKALRLGRQRDARLRAASKLYRNAQRRFNKKDSLALRELFTYLHHYVPSMLKEYGGDDIPSPQEVGALRFELAMNLLRTYLPSNLYSGDRNSMAHGIECRYPFLDYALVDFATHLPDWAYLEQGWGKAIVRQAMDHAMPPDITWRADKVGFAAPQDTWLRSPAMTSWIEERVFDSALGTIPGYEATMMRHAWETHKNGTNDHALLLWKWASASELLNMQRSGAWGSNIAPPAAQDTRPIAWIISYTPVCKEPRVIRQAAALTNAGWRVVVFGLEGEKPPPKEWDFIPLSDSLPLEGRDKMQWLFGKRMGKLLFSLYIRTCGATRTVGMLFARFGIFPKLRVLGARVYQRMQLPFHWKRRIISAYCSNSPAMQPQLVLCHDYFTADIGLSIARRTQAKIVVDCHEYACGQHVHIPNWVKWHLPYVYRLQDFYLNRADAVTTVCEGIAALIRTDHHLKCPVEVVRSTPFYEAQPFRPTGEIITVLYHGEIFPTRGLHVAIRSMQYWRPEFRMVLRGNADAAYLEELNILARNLGVENRLTIEPAVPFKDIISAANKADIGYFVHEDLSPQRRFTLPNKFFEYVMAGLALCVSDLPEMARLVKQYEMGQLVSDCDPKAIAEVINRFDRPMIDSMKQRALEAARMLNWEAEKQRMLKLYEGILS
ncbi:MAG: asparagine synthase-related protein, partial [Alphaproteobacteria bacterium]